jgi:hypothetical protein
VPLSSRLSLSIAGTAAVALASLPLGITPASAARVSEGTTSTIGVVEDASNVQKFNLGSLGPQGASNVIVARGGRNGVGRGFPQLLLELLEHLGINTTASNNSPFAKNGSQFKGRN